MEFPEQQSFFPEQANPVSAQNDLYTLPLTFVSNAGQAEAPVKFQAHSRHGTLFFTSEEVVITLPNPQDRSAGMNQYLISSQVVSTNTDAEKTVVRLRFIGANSNPQIIGNQAQGGVVNYLIGNNPNEWHTDLPTYAEVIYQDVYPGINLHYDGTEGLLKGTYVVAPGVDPNHIRWSYSGVSNTQVDQATGNLIITVNEGGGTLTEKAPIAWQEIQGQQIPVNVSYKVTADGTVSLAIGAYDNSYPLVIDPTLEYSSYLGGNGNDFGGILERDDNGNLYIAGRTQSTDFPGTNGKTTDDENGFIAKLQADGSGLEFSTYFGGSGDDFLYGFVLDSSGHLYISGETNSTDLPGSGGDNQLVGGNDGFVARLDPDGSGLDFGRYLGGTETDTASGLAVDSADKVYVVGRTNSTDFPTVNPLQATNAGEYDFIVARLSTTGTLEYSTYLGGSGNENRRDGGIALNTADEIYIFGATSSTDFPTTAGVLQEKNAGGVDLFITKLNNAGDNILFSTYLGGSGNDQTAAFGAHAMKLDVDNNIYVTGLSLSNDFPTTPGVAQPNFVGQNFDGIVAKIAPDGNQLLFGTYLGGGNSGGNGNDFMSGIAVDPAGNVYVTGHAHSVDFPLKNAIQSDKIGASGPSDANITKLKPDGSLDYSTFFGGSLNEWGHDIEVDENGTAYALLYSLSNDVPLITNDAFQSESGGEIDMVIAKISSVLQVNQVGDPLVAAANSLITYTLTVENSSPQTVTATILTDTLPTGMTFERVIPNNICQVDSDKVICNIGTLNISQLETIEIVARTPMTVSAPLVNNVEVTAQHANLGSLTYHVAETTFFDAANMSVDIVAPNPDVNIAGDVGTNSVLTYPITVTNSGPNVATGVVLTSTLSDGMQFISANPTTCNETAGTIVCDLDTLAVDASKNVTITARAPGERGGLQNIVTVASDVPDQDTTNNNTTASNFAEVYSATVAVTNTAQSDGESAFTYTLQLINTSSWFATFDLTVTGNSWSTAVTPTEIVALEHLGRRPNFTPTAMITVTVTAPANRANIYSDTATINIIPRGAPDDVVTIDITSRRTMTPTTDNHYYVPMIYRSEP